MKYVNNKIIVNLPFALLLFCSNTVYSQSYIDLVKIEHTQNQAVDFENDHKKSFLSKSSLDFTLPLPINDGFTILSGVNYNYLHGRLNPDMSIKNFSAFQLKLGVNIRHHKNLKATYMLLPKLAGDNILKYNTQDFQFGGLVLFDLKKNDFFKYNFGLYGNTDRFGPFFVPIFGFHYVHQKYEIKIGVPVFGFIEYHMKPKIDLGLHFRATVRSFHFEQAIFTNNNYLTQMNNETALYVAYEPIKGFIFRFLGGFTLGRSMRMYEENDKIDFGISLFRFGDERKALNTDFNDGLFARFEFVYRYYLEDEN